MWYNNILSGRRAPRGNTYITTTVLSSNDDDSSYEIPLGFTLTFLGSTYTQSVVVVVVVAVVVGGSRGVCLVQVVLIKTLIGVFPLSLPSPPPSSSSSPLSPPSPPPSCLLLLPLPTSVWVSSNTYMTFGSPAASYTDLGAKNPGVPSIHIASCDNSAQRIGYRQGTSTDGSNYCWIR